jgi:DNA adenine methylase
MVERDEEIAAVWQSVVKGDADWIADRIIEFKLTKENVLNEINKPYDDIKHIAFQTILKNRTLHGGILAEGSSFIKYGENGKGIQSRWYPKTLATRFRNLDFVASRIGFICGDGLQVLRDYAANDDTVFLLIRLIRREEEKPEADYTNIMKWIMNTFSNYVSHYKAILS